MPSSGKKKTTMAKLMRESRMRERKLEKKNRKDARQHSPLLDTEQLEASLVNGMLPDSEDHPVDDTDVDEGD